MQPPNSMTRSSARRDRRINFRSTHFVLSQNKRGTKVAIRQMNRNLKLTSINPVNPTADIKTKANDRSNESTQKMTW
jgi:hypothetical protein